MTIKTIRLASVVYGSETPAGDGITGAMRCIIKIGNEQRLAILKRIPEGEVAAELLATVLLSGWGLSVPDPFLVAEENGLAFASALEGYPNLKQHLSVDNLPEGIVRDLAYKEAIKIASELASAPLAAVCDEAIDNRDRNLGNILWDGENDAWIDHATCFGEWPHLENRNILCEMANINKISEAFCRKATAQALLLDRNMPQQTLSFFNDISLPIDAKAQYVTQRLQSLANRILARFPQPDDLLLFNENK